MKLATEKTCTGCLACIDACNHNALSVENKYGHRFVKVETNSCVDCGLCEQVCPVINKVKSANKVGNIKVFGAWSKNEKIRQQAASGGAFSELAISVIKKGGKVFGACLENNSVFHICIDKEKDLIKLQNSKYIQSDTTGVYKQVKSLLKEENPILFSGTPCQIAGLYGYLKNKDYPNLFTVEVVCYGVPSKEALDFHLKKYNSSEIISFRDKTDGWWGKESQRTTIRLDNVGKKLKRKDDFFYQIFASNLTERKSCFNCQFSALPRMADITLADFWGTDCSMEEQKKGVSLIITNNNKGYDQLIKTDGLYYFESTIEKCTPSNPRILYGKKALRFHPVVLFHGFFENLPPKLKFDIYTNKMPWKLVWGIFKVFTKIAEKKHQKKIVKLFR